MARKHIWLKLSSLLLTLALGVGLLGGAVSANAAGTQFQTYQIIIKAVMDATTKAIGLSNDDLLKGLGKGLTLSAMIEDNKGDVAAIKADAKATVVTQASQLVTQGTLTQDQANDLLARLDDLVDAALYLPLPGRAQSAEVVIGWAMIDATERATKLTTIQLLKLIGMGENFTKIITDNGGDVAAVKSTVKADITAQVNDAVKNGTIPQAGATKFIAGLDPILTKAFTTMFGDGKGGAFNRESRLLRTGSLGLLLKQTADASQISQRDELQAIHSGQTLAQIATQHNADPSKIVSLAMIKITARINELVKNGKVDQTEADALQSGLQTDLTNLMNMVNPLGTTATTDNSMGMAATAQATDQATPPVTATAAATATN